MIHSDSQPIAIYENEVLKRADERFDETLSILKEFISYKSISADPKFDKECKKTAEWIVKYLKRCGFSAKSYETDGLPIIVGHTKKSFNDTKALFYGHYDVQPPDPIELWETDPFVGEIKDGAIFGRGASDDKGQVITFLEAFRFWYELTRCHPIHGVIVLEGEEEVGSKSLKNFLVKERDTLKSNFGFICDTPQIDESSPAIITSLRGLITAEIVVSTGLNDLHSGMYGGVANNAINILCGILGSLYDENGIVNIPDFYSDIENIPPAKIKSWVDSGYFQGVFSKVIGLDASKEEMEKIATRVWGSPSLDINGIFGGYTGSGSKTIIPSQASAKISMRLVPKQDPDKILQNLENYIKKTNFKGVRIEVRNSQGAPATTFNTEADFFKPVKIAMSREWNKPPADIGCGGSIAVASLFNSVLGIDMGLIGFGLEDDKIHSPNEKYNINSLRRGTRSWISILSELSNLGI